MAKFTVQQKITDPATGHHVEFDIECDAYEGPDEFGLVKFIDQVETQTGAIGKKLVLLLDWDSTVSIRRYDTDGDLAGSRDANKATRVNKRAAAKEAETVGAGV